MSLWVWLAFGGLLAALLAIDLGVLNRKAHVIGVREALRQWAVWVGCALLFTGLLYFLYDAHVGGLGRRVPQISKEVRDVGGLEAAQLFLTGYIVEASLSMDNMLVIALILGHFRVPREHQHRVLFWGIIGAVVLRGAMIVIGAALLKQYHWIIYVFGAILLASAVKLLVMREGEEDVGHSFAVRAARTVLRVSPAFEGSRFFTRIPVGDSRGPSSGPAPAGARTALFATPLFLALVVVDIADVIFAIDSIPAIFGITLDPFIVFTSNCFAILGLRAIYFAIAAMIESFRYMKASMVFVLAFIGVKMLLPLGPAAINAGWRLSCWLSAAMGHSEVSYGPVIPPEAHWDISPTASLLVIIGILGVGLLASVFVRPSARTPQPATGADELLELADLAVRNSRKLVIAVIGGTVILLAIPIGVLLPGPGGIPLAILGLAILASEFVWARRMLKRVHREKDALLRRARTLVGLDSARSGARTPDADPAEGERGAKSG